MTEFVSIKEAKATKKGNIKGTIISMKDIKKGGTAEKPWSRLDMVMKDESDTVKFTAWGDDIPKFKLGGIYELVKPQWGVYETEVQVQPSKFGSIKHVETVPVTAAVKAEPHPDRPNEEIPDMDTSLRGVVHCKTVEMLQIEKEVRGTFSDMCPQDANNGNKVGMYTRTIFALLNNKSKPDD